MPALIITLQQRSCLLHVATSLLVFAAVAVFPHTYAQLSPIRGITGAACTPFPDSDAATVKWPDSSPAVFIPCQQGALYFRQEFAAQFEWRASFLPHSCPDSSVRQVIADVAEPNIVYIYCGLDEFGQPFSYRIEVLDLLTFSTVRVVVMPSTAPIAKRGRWLMQRASDSEWARVDSQKELPDEYYTLPDGAWLQHRVWTSDDMEDAYLEFGEGLGLWNHTSHSISQVDGVPPLTDMLIGSGNFSGQLLLLPAASTELRVVRLRESNGPSKSVFATDSVCPTGAKRIMLHPSQPWPAFLLGCEYNGVFAISATGSAVRLASAEVCLGFISFTFWPDGSNSVLLTCGNGAVLLPPYTFTRMHVDQPCRNSNGAVVVSPSITIMTCDNQAFVLSVGSATQKLFPTVLPPVLRTSGELWLSDGLDMQRLQLSFPIVDPLDPNPPLTVPHMKTVALANIPNPCQDDIDPRIANITPLPSGTLQRLLDVALNPEESGIVAHCRSGGIWLFAATEETWLELLPGDTDGCAFASAKLVPMDDALLLSCQSADLSASKLWMLRIPSSERQIVFSNYDLGYGFSSIAWHPALRLLFVANQQLSVVWTLDPAILPAYDTMAEVLQRSQCAQPGALQYDPHTRSMLVQCQSSTLVRISPDGTSSRILDTTCSLTSFTVGTQGAVMLTCAEIGVVALTDAMSCPTGGGLYYEDGTCKPCAVNSYRGPNSILPVTDCEPCAPGSTTRGLTGQPRCVLCGRGTKEEGGICVQCAIGTEQPALGAVNCTRCTPGYVAPAVGQAVCEACSVGTAQSAHGQQCTECPPGRASAIAGSVSCAVCPAYTYSLDVRSTECLPCGGALSNATERTSCICPAGTSFTAGLGCVPCQLGLLASTANSLSCSVCPLDSYTPSVGAAACKPCTDTFGLECNGGRAFISEGYWPQLVESTSADGRWSAEYIAVQCPSNHCQGKRLLPDVTIFRALRAMAGSGAEAAALVASHQQLCVSPRINSLANALCADCEAGFRPWGSHCSVCDSADGGLIVAGIILAIGQLLLVLIGAAGGIRAATERKAGTFVERPGDGAVDALVYFIQTGALEVSEVTRYLQWTSWLNLGTSSTPSCLAPIKPTVRALLDWLMPLFFGVLLIALAATTAVLKKCMPATRRQSAAQVSDEHGIKTGDMWLPTAAVNRNTGLGQFANSQHFVRLAFTAVGIV